RAVRLQPRAPASWRALRYALTAPLTKPTPPAPTTPPAPPSTPSSLS
ncbi:MAG: hypothetical protein H7067_02675, partial [Burkholderiales bacterium]|nr:hypothetical protein [Opitutaceae bacterium]